MAIWNTITKDLKVDSNYGDLELVNNDLKTETRRLFLLKNTIIERYKTNINDFKLNASYGANLDRFIGRGIDNRLVENIITSFKFCLTYDNFIDSTLLEILPVVVNNTVKLYTYINIGNETISIETTYDLTEGVFTIA